MLLSKIKKRDGRVTDFDPDRIRNAVHKAFLAVELGNGEKAESITSEVVSLLKEKFKEKTPSVEDTQDLVIEVLEKKGYEKVAQAYQDFRKKKEELRA
jgi:anaerobic ribonucleoside-triphosphate reductase